MTVEGPPFPTLITSIGIVTVRDDATALIYLKEPMTCPGCNRVAYFVIQNVDHTQCLTCDYDRKLLAVTDKGTK